MTNHNNLPQANRARLPENITTGLRAAAVTLGLMLGGVPAAEAHQRPESQRLPNIGELIATQEKQESRDIAHRKAVTAKAAIAHYHGPGRHFYIKNPLFETVREDDHRLELIGSIEPTGRRSGPKVTFIEYNPRTTDLTPDHSDRLGGGQRIVSFEVIFPTSEGPRSFDLNNPTNPATAQWYYDKAGEPIEVGHRYDSKQ